MSWKRWLLIAAAVVVAVVGVGAAVAARLYSSMAVQTQNAFTERELPSPLDGKPAPGFTLPLAGGGSASLAGFRGKPVLVVFWSTW